MLFFLRISVTPVGSNVVQLKTENPSITPLNTATASQFSDPFYRIETLPV